jgi:hypothetical protein
MLGKKLRDALIVLAQRNGWEIGYQDEVWWSRVSQPNLHSWSEQDEPLRLQELAADKNDPDPKALACYGMLSATSGRMYLRFVSGRPVSQVTTDLSFVAVPTGPGARQAGPRAHLG